MLQRMCDRCQAYSRNFTQIVRQGAETYCVHCDAAIKERAATRMYAETLPHNSPFECSAEMLGDQATSSSYCVNGRGFSVLGGAHAQSLHRIDPLAYPACR